VWLISGTMVESPEPPMPFINYSPVCWSVRNELPLCEGQSWLQEFYPMFSTEIIKVALIKGQQSMFAHVNVIQS
jgi:hypothetical protein